MPFVDSLFVNTGRRRLTINLLDAERIEDVEDGVRLYFPDRCFVHESSFSTLAKVLDPSKFLRVSASTIVNLDRVDEFTLLPTGEFTVTLRDGTTLAASAMVGDQMMAFTQRR